ncbi:hypothetical protein ACFQ0M_27710 [Kitasatospora aburaviensis]
MGFRDLPGESADGGPRRLRVRAAKGAAVCADLFGEGPHGRGAPRGGRIEGGIRAWKSATSAGESRAEAAAWIREVAEFSGVAV